MHSTVPPWLFNYCSLELIDAFADDLYWVILSQSNAFHCATLTFQVLFSRVDWCFRRWLILSYLEFIQCIPLCHLDLWTTVLSSWLMLLNMTCLEISWVNPMHSTVPPWLSNYCSLELIDDFEDDLSWVILSQSNGFHCTTLTFQLLFSRVDWCFWRWLVLSYLESIQCIPLCHLDFSTTVL